MTTKPWFASWFESPWYVRLYGHRTQAEAQMAVTLATRTAGIPVGAHVLDLCCGYGRHAAALAEAGYRVTGLDGSSALIARAREYNAHDAVTYHVGDMRGPYPDPPYDAVVNFFTSFGYFDTDAEHRAVLQTIHEALVPGGMLVMDFLNADLVRRTLVPETMTMVDGVTIIQERRIEEPFVHKRITVTNPCSTEETYDERVWLYGADDLTAMITDAGFTVRNVHGSYTGEPFDRETSDRCIIVAERQRA